MTITIRRARVDDAAAIARLMDDPAVYPGLMQMPYASEEAQRARLAESLAPGKADLLLVAERGGEVVGSCGMHPGLEPAPPPRDDDRHLGARRCAGAGRRQRADAGSLRLRGPLDRLAAPRALRVRRQRTRDRAVPPLRVRDRRTLSRLRAARRCLRRRVRDGARASRAARDRRRIGEATRREGVALGARRLPLRLARLRVGRGARLVPEPRRSRQRAGRADRPLLRRGDRAGAGDRDVPRLRRCLRPQRRAGAADARVRGALQRPGPARAGGRFADAALREGALHAAHRQAPGDAGEPPARCARRDRLPRAAPRRRCEAHRPDRLVARRQHRARARSTCAIATSLRRRSSRRSRSPSIPAAKPTSSAATRPRRRC